MKVIGLTGGIATGKSKMSDYLREKGAVIVCADTLARELVEPGRPGNTAIREAFGEAYFNEGGALERKKLGKYVFANEQELKRLNAILHPLIHQEVLQRIEECRKQGVKLVVLDAPLLFETGMEKLVEEVWLMVTDEAIQIKRVMKRDGVSREEALQRIRSQMPQEEKKKLAQVLLDSSGPVEQTRRLADCYWNERLK